MLEIARNGRHSDAALTEGNSGRHRGFRTVARTLWSAGRALAEKAADAVRQALPGIHRPLTVSRHRLLRPDRPLRCLTKRRCAWFCSGARRRDLADPRPARQQPRRHDRQPAGTAGGRSHFLRARHQRNLAGEWPRALTTERALLEPLAVNGKAPRSGILVTADEIYFHCGKALIRSDLWNPEKQLRRSEFPSLGQILADQIGGISVEESERLTAESYRTRLY